MSPRRSRSSGRAPARREPPRFVVALGASAGGLKALSAFFERVPADSGLAYVVVVHLAPDHESHLADLLQKHAAVPVQQVTGSVDLEADHAYVIPPNAQLESVDGRLQLSPLEARPGPRAPVDHFLRKLAHTHDGHAVAVILTGTGSDGALGIRDVKECNGLVVVQDPEEAEFDGMPRSALTTGLVDLVLPLNEIPGAIVRFAETRPRLGTDFSRIEQDDELRALLHKAFAQVRLRTGRDFTRYKRSTILRRITRRMQLHRLEELGDYLELLTSDAKEARDLSNDLLITVTSFFRDPDVFQALEEQVVPRLLDEHGPDREVRAWSVGCATGEEAYSLAMLFLEGAARRELAPRIQIFASDLHATSLERARRGSYSSEIENDIGGERLRRFFEPFEGGYRIRREVRDVVVFAPHNLLSDPPFSHLDLVLCRNLLIYLQRGVQGEVIELFHYALRPEGTLVLGTSETLEHSDLFRVEDKQRCVYRKRNVPVPEPRLPVFPVSHLLRMPEPEAVERDATPAAYGALHLRMVERHAPPSMLLNPEDRVVHLSEHAGRYLLHPGGELTSSAVKLVREELCAELRTALFLAREEKRPVRTQPIALELNEGSALVELQVRPARDGGEEGFVLVIFDEHPPTEDSKPPPAATDQPELNTAERQLLEEQLSRTRQRLQAIVEEYETSQEEMKASNEELQSSNEELRSTMEELETSKEELQSMNEELQAVNQENRHKVEELAQLSSDLQNLLVSTDIATLFLDRDFRIMRFTPRLAELFHARGTDRGRPLSDLTHDLEYPGLLDDARRVLGRLVPVEREVRDRAGRWYLARIGPYRSTQDRISGVVLTLVDITERKRTELELAEGRKRLEVAVEAAGGGVYEHAVPLDETTYHARQWAAILGYEPEALPDYRGFAAWLRKHVHPDDRDTFERTHEDFVQGRTEEYRAELRLRHRQGRWVWVQALARALERRPDGTVLRLVGIMLDVTLAKEAEHSLRSSEQMFRGMTDDLPLMVVVQGPQGEIDFVNQACARFFGRSLGELPGGGWLELVDPTDEDYRRLYAQCVQAREGFYGQVRARRADGEQRWIETWALPRTDHQGRFLGMIVTSADCHDRKQTEEALREKTAELERADRNKALFIATLGHELRNPLAAIDGALRAVESGLRSLDELEPTLLTHIRQLTLLVNDLLEVSRITEGKITLRSGRVDLADVIRSSVEKALEYTAERGQEIDLSVEDTLQVVGDRTRLEQVVSNLLSNASKYSPEGARIQLGLRRAGPEEALLFVEDEGEGLDREQLLRVFEPFMQAGQTPDGLGIGLTLVKSLVELHGGSVSAESEGPGRGARFEVRLPIGDLEGCQAEEPAPRTPQASLPAGRVLVIDDTRDAADLLALMLESAGARVKCAYTGAEGLERFRSWSPQVVLIDIRLPDMTGYDVVHALRGEPGGSEVLMLAVTGFGEPEIRDRCRSAGFDERLVKPVDMQALMELLSSHLASRTG